MPIAKPGKNNNSTHPFTVSDGAFKYGLTIMNEVVDQPHVASTINVQPGGTAYGEWGPFTSEEQSNWEGGRAQEVMEDDTQFYDSMNLWSWNENKLHPSLRWKFGKGIRTANFYMPGDVTWFKLLGDGQYLSNSFTAGEDYDAAKAMLWVRRVGNPGTLTACLYSDSTDEPDSSLKSSTVTITTITDVISVLHEFIFSSVQALANGTKYHVVIFGDSDDNDANHWEVAVDADGTDSLQSADGSTWEAAGNSMYYRVTDVDVEKKLHLFELEGMWYAVSEPDDGGASTLWMNGYRGVATAGSDTTLTDTNASFVADALIGMKIRIINGKKAAKRQVRTITDNTDTVITVDDWDVNPTSTSRYVIYGEDEWFEVSQSELDSPVYDVAVMNKIAYFARGDEENIVRMRFNHGGSPPAHQLAEDGTNKADQLHVYNETTNGNTRIYRAVNSDNTNFSRSPLKDWGTALVFTDAKSFGDSTYEITNIFDYDNKMWGIKEDGLWKLESDIPQRINIGIDAMPSWINGQAVCTQNLFLYFSFSHSIERMQGTTFDDIGPWKGTGLPEDRKGPVSVLEPVVSWIFVGVDGGEGISSVLVYNQRGYGELFRGWYPGRRVRNIKWQPIYDGRPKLWINIGGDLVYMEFPQDTLNPLRDSDVEYQHEAVFVSSVIDLGHTALKKAFRKVALINGNSDEIRVYLDYQVDDDIGSDQWVEAGMFSEATRDTIEINEGSRTKFRYRLRMLTDEDGVPPEIEAVVVEVFERIEEKRQLQLVVKSSEFAVDSLGNQDAKPNELYPWLLVKQNEADMLYMESVYDEWHGKRVIIDNVIPRRSRINLDSGLPENIITITFREA